MVLLKDMDGEEVKYKRTIHTDVFELTSWDKVPSYLSYPYILNGYRNNFSFKLCVKSLFRVHTETGNIWTHLMAFLCFVGFFIYTFKYVLKEDDPFQDKLFFFVFHMGALANFLTSACYHTFNCHCLDTCQMVARMDFGGISNHICCSWLLLANYLFYDNFTIQSTYIFLISCFSAFMLICPKVVIESHIARVIGFSLMALFGIVPVTHWILRNGFYSHMVQTFILSFAIDWVIYFIGLCVFLWKIPERFFPGKFDYWFNSHQIWHVFVWLGNSWFHWKVVQSLAIYHHQQKE